MAVKENLEKWTAAMQSFDELKLEESLDKFLLFADTSKVRFNVGMVAQRLRYNDQAIEAFSEAIAMDSFFAAAYFQRGVLLFFEDNVEAAVEDFQDAYEKLRGNTHINYTQLGLEYVLHECYIILNISLCFLALGEIDRGLKYMDQAIQSAQSATRGSSVQPDTSKIEDALRKGEDADGKVLPSEIPDTLIFRPQEDNVKNSKKVDYLGKSKIVAGADKSDNFNGFSGRQQKELTLGRNYRKKIATSENTKQVEALAASAVKLDTITRRPSNTDSLPRRPSNANATSPSLSRRPSNLTNGGDRRPSNTDSRNSPTSPAQAKRPFRGRSSSIASTLPKPISTSKNSIFRDDLMDSPLEYNNRDYGSKTAPATDSKGPFTRSPKSAANNASRDPFGEEDEYRNDTIKSSKPLTRRATEPTIESSEYTESSFSPNDDKIRVKAYYNGCRFVHVPYDATYKILLDSVCAKFRNPNLLLKYQDEEERKTIMSNDDDLAEALDLAEEEGKLEVWCFVPAA